MKTLLFSLALALLLASCLEAPKAGNEPEGASPTNAFRLPAGDAKQGKEAFVGLACHRCHSVRGEELPDFGLAAAGLDLSLAESIEYVKTYGDLLTAVTNPEHVVSEKYKAILAATGDTDVRSAMPEFVDKMTVRQLIDIVAFLEVRYQELGDAYSGSIGRSQ